MASIILVAALATILPISALGIVKSITGSNNKSNSSKSNSSNKKRNLKSTNVIQSLVVNNKKQKREMSPVSLAQQPDIDTVSETSDSQDDNEYDSDYNNSNDDFPDLPAQSQLKQQHQYSFVRTSNVCGLSSINSVGGSYLSEELYNKPLLHGEEVSDKVFFDPLTKQTKVGIQNKLLPGNRTNSSHLYKHASEYYSVPEKKLRSAVKQQMQKPVFNRSIIDVKNRLENEFEQVNRLTPYNKGAEPLLKYKDISEPCGHNNGNQCDFMEEFRTNANIHNQYLSQTHQGMTVKNRLDSKCEISDRLCESNLMNFGNCSYDNYKQDLRSKPNSVALITADGANRGPGSENTIHFIPNPRITGQHTDMHPSSGKIGDSMISVPNPRSQHIIGHSRDTGRAFETHGNRGTLEVAHTPNQYQMRRNSRRTPLDASDIIDLRPPMFQPINGGDAAANQQTSSFRRATDRRQEIPLPQRVNNPTALMQSSRTAQTRVHPRRMNADTRVHSNNRPPRPNISMQLNAMYRSSTYHVGAGHINEIENSQKNRKTATASIPVRPSTTMYTDHPTGKDMSQDSAELARSLVYRHRDSAPTSVYGNNNPVKSWVTQQNVTRVEKGRVAQINTQGINPAIATMYKNATDFDAGILANKVGYDGARRSTTEKPHARAPTTVYMKQETNMHKMDPLRLTAVKSLPIGTQANPEKIHLSSITRQPTGYNLRKPLENQLHEYNIVAKQQYNNTCGRNTAVTTRTPDQNVSANNIKPTATIHAVSARTTSKLRQAVMPLHAGGQSMDGAAKPVQQILQKSSSHNDGILARENDQQHYYPDTIRNTDTEKTYIPSSNTDTAVHIDNYMSVCQSREIGKPCYEDVTLKMGDGPKVDRTQMRSENQYTTLNTDDRDNSRLVYQTQNKLFKEKKAPLRVNSMQSGFLNTGNTERLLQDNISID